MNKTILIIGATGFIGTRVCEAAHSQGYQVISIRRPASDISHIQSFVKKFFTTDLLSPSCRDDIRSQIKDIPIDYMISLVGSVDYHQSYEQARHANVNTTRSVIQIAKYLQGNNGLQKMVFGGSVTSRGFMGKVSGLSDMINESSDYLKEGLSVYCDVKREAEDLINDAIKTDQLKAVIVEPGSLIGKPIGITTTTNIGLIRKIIKGFPVLKGGASYTSLNRVVDGIILALEKGKIGETYLLGGENMTMKEFALLVRSVLQKKYPHIPMPKIPVYAISRSVGIILGKMNFIINSHQAVMGNGFHYIDSSKAKNDLGYQHSLDDLEQALGEVLNLYG
jgi:dihydroflavonol-4-reductase